MDAIRASLLSAVARGRLVPVPQVRPAPSPRPHRELSGLAVEELQYLSDDSPQGWVPLRLVKAVQAAGQRLPVAILLHATGVDMNDLLPQQAEFAGRGYLVAAIDCRYQGGRADPAFPDAREGYEAALVRAWREGRERPFLLDNVWDLQRLLDYLATRPDVDAERVGVTGVSLGGMHSWLLAAADERVAVAAPIIGVQSFRWAVDNDQWQGRVGSMPQVFEAARQDMGRSQLDSAVVRAVWDRLLPGLLSDYDAPQSLPLIAPRPLLVANGELDPRCPLQGVHLALEAAAPVYRAADAPHALGVFIDRGVGHECTLAMWREVGAWLHRFLQPAAPRAPWFS